MQLPTWFEILTTLLSKVEVRSLRLVPGQDAPGDQRSKEYDQPRGHMEGIEYAQTRRAKCHRCRITSDG